MNIKNEIAYIVLNNPEKGNVLTQEVKNEIRDTFMKIKYDYKIRVIIISGNGKHFCVGGDVKTMKGINSIQARDRMRKNGEWIKEVANIEKPVISAVHGAAAGAGLGIALASDFIVAAEDAKFVSSFINIGLVSDMSVLYFLPRRVGLANAKRISYSGKPVLAEDAFKIGMIDQVVCKGDLMKEAEKMAREFLDKPTYVLGMTKKLANESFETNFNEFLEKEIYYQTVAFQTEDHKNSLDSFINKKESKFKGI
ncbi:enoyl-CoA hydratase/isomerase family protein [Dethiosulfatibacter aminovorans]|uniref:enoyl-CoA hydratase/isomerase family protein n=1 Tax=Dethiosulfatibacter aminovorans TaxID=332095 RepID=UPI00093353A5|nr:enoyl-CoA hydratase/isomerase family protein [Dethiosulfatibacter aminovorans]